MAHGSSARGRRRQRRAAIRSVEEGVRNAPVETQTVVASATETLAIPESADYRPAASDAESCANCEAYSDGQCSMWDAAVQGDYTCDSFKAREAAGAAAIEVRDGFAEIAASLEPFGGEPSEGTKADKRLKKNKAAAETVTAAAGDLVWGPEEGFQDLLCDINCAINPPDSFRYWACDVSLDLSKAVVSDWEGGCSYVVPITVNAEMEPTVAPFQEWVEADSALIEATHASIGKIAGYASPEESGTASTGGTMRMTLKDFTFAGAETNLPVELAPGETLPEQRPTPAVPEAPLPAGTLKWTATLAPEGKATEDGRIFAPGSITWRELPLSLMGMVKTAEGHDGAEVCGRIEQIWRDESSGLIRGSGEFDTGDFGLDIARLVDDQTLRGVSVDIAVAEMEIAYRDEVVDEDGVWKADQAEPEEGSEAPSMIDVLFGGEQEMIFVVRQGIIGAATVCPFPAFADAQIELAASLTAAKAPTVWTVTSQAGFVVTVVPHTGEVEAGGRMVPELLTDEINAALLASGLAPTTPPSDWFRDPELEELTPLTIDDEGRIFGHAAGWDVCHIGIPGVCTTAPHTATGNAYFHSGEIVCDDGERFSIGKITMGTGHAGDKLGWSEAASHYDNTGTVVGDVISGEDDYGIWVAGALRPNVDEERLRELRAAPLSGDWRDVNGNLELVAVLAVNVGGFPIPRTRAALVASADRDSMRVVTLTAAGIHYDGKVATPKPPELTEEEQAGFDLLRQALAVDMPCSGCDHAMAAHEDDMGACSVEGCSCMSYEGS